MGRVTGKRMLAVVDIETRGLDARNFVTACLIKENGKKKHFYSKEELWKYILELGRKEMKRKKVLNLYAHNHEYDFYGYADLTDTSLQFFSFRPFIANYTIDGKKAINFLDSFAIFKMSLKKLGEMVGLEKLDTPEEFINAERLTKKRIMELRPYVERDVEIVLKAIKLMKDKMDGEGVRLRRLYTISQIAVAYLINTLKQKDYDEMFYIKERGVLHKTRYKELIHGAYRGGRVECFKLGDFESVDYIDINNLYGYASTKIKFPNLRTEQMIREPLKYVPLNSILQNIGISRVLIYNRSNEIGLLPVRTDTGNYYPKKDTHLLGTYTHIELEEAIKEGYEIINVEWSLIWQETRNPFKIITPKLYELRKKSKESFDNFFYKEMQNRSYGKLAQRRSGQDIVIDSVEKAREYLANNYEILRGEGYNYMYRKDKPEKEKSYYAPIIPTLINAYARVYMYKMFKRLPISEIIYTDTDSCIMKEGNLDRFKDVINEGIGFFKVEHKGERCIIKGKKTYAIGDEIKVSGFRKSDVTMKDFEKGEIKSRKMQTLKTSKDLKDVGGFIEETRDLNEQKEINEQIMSIYKKEKVFKDRDITNISYFTGDLVEIAEK